MARALPTRADLVDYKNAVAGHDGTLCDADGELFIKPCTQTEIDFYESSTAYHPEFADIMPIFMGTLSLDDPTIGATIEEASAKLLAAHNEASVQEAREIIASNGVKPVTNGVSHQEPISLAASGTTAIRKPGKRIVTNQAVVLENTSHGFVKPNIMDVKLGVRLWAPDAAEEKQIRFDAITEETTHRDLGFRVAGMRVWQGAGAQGENIDAEGYKIYDKEYGRYSLNNDNVHEAFRHFCVSLRAGVDEELGKLIMEAFASDVRRIQAVLESQESRMFSASLLFVFEGDGEALRKAMEAANQTPSTSVSEEDEEDEEAVLPKILVVKVIDFAHATWTPGEGPDENSLIGVRSIAKILEDLSTA